VINLRFIFTSIVTFIVIFCGCAQSLHNPTVSQTRPAYNNKKNISPLPEDGNTDNVQPLLDAALNFCQLSQAKWQRGEIQSAVDALDKAYSYILKVNDENISPGLKQQKKDLRFTISKRILEIYASRNIVASGNHNAIPMIMNSQIQQQIESFTTPGRERNFLVASYKRSGKYRQQIIKELKKAGLPEKLSWLPLIESGFRANALSKARALGLWQFIPSTGYKFGLKRNIYIDERLDPMKSTKAAIAYLKELHGIFGDWATVLAAYNCGEGRVLRLIRAQNINYLDNFWDLHERLPRETAKYVPRFISVLHIFSNPEKYGLDKIEIDTPVQFETISIAKQVYLKDIAMNTGLSEDTLSELNPELRYRLLPKDEYQLRVPPGKGEIILAKLADLPVSDTPRAAYVYHRVKLGDTLSNIARRYNSNVLKIMRTNKLHKSDYIVVGKKLKIPRSSESQTPAAVATGVSPTHKVRKGDSLWGLAKKYHTTNKKIQAINNLKTTKLMPGQIIKIPSRTGRQFKTYKVKTGDSPYLIAMAYEMSLERFLSINNLMPSTKIYPNQKLYVE
jgi:membrane-bound lytic murein transglycosylase D